LIWPASRWRSSSVIAGLDPAIHLHAKKMDPRVKPAADGAKDWINFSRPDSSHRLPIGVD
jgi:hypothetical protein